MENFCQRGHPKYAENTFGKNQCKPCHKLAVAAYEKTAECREYRKVWAKGLTRQDYMKAYLLKNKDAYYYRHAKRKYGLSKEEILTLFATQNGKCAICKVPEVETGERFHIDHNHSTGKVRGLLCRSCNNFVVVAVEQYSHLFDLTKSYLGGL